MTKNESFKKKVRVRMAKTGEKYGAARRALLNVASGPRPRVNDPEYPDSSVREATGKGWDEWCDLIDGWPEREQGHTAIAARLGDELDDAWWCQTVVVGYERIRGLRTKYMRADGSFAGGTRRTIAVDGDRLRADLLDDQARAELLPDVETTLRSRPTAKTLRIAIADAGVAQFSLTSREDGRWQVGVEHVGLGSSDEVEHWKDFWADWLADRAETSRSPRGGA